MWTRAGVFVIFIFGVVCFGATITVNRNGSGDYTTIQAAIDAAVDDDEIEVAAGTYNEVIDFLGKVVRLYSIDGPAATTIDGSGLNSSVVTCISGEDRNSILKGFTIKGGNVSGEVDDPNFSGGGMLNLGSSPTVINCIFRDNTADYGGGIYSSEGNPMINSCKFNHNLANVGAGMFVEHASPEIVDCIFTDNIAESYAGGIYIGGVKSMSILTDCNFIGNFAGIDGGGVFNNGATSLLTRCAFTTNYAGSKGGGMVESGVSTLVDCVFMENSSSFAGGAMATGPHFLIGPATLINCLFIRNSADRYGGAMDNYIAAVFMNNCTFVDNAAPEGSALYCSSFPQEPPTFVRAISCIFRDGGNEIFDGGFSTIQILYSNVQDGWSGPGDIDQNPLFVDTTIDDYHLLWNSPCIDTGDPGFVVDPNFPVDIDGEPRVMGIRVDMGADEVGPKQADFTRDGVINIDDFGVLGNSWGTGPSDEKWYVLCDLWEDGVIGLEDMIVFVEDWLWMY